jgi:sugar phosphate isomerase/epimerase
LPEIGVCTGTLLLDPLAASDADIRAAGEAALSAGFTEASVWLQHLAPLTGAGLHVAVVEAALAWANGEPADAKAEAERFAAAAAEHSAARIGAACLEPALQDAGKARENLALLVEAAESAGAQVCLEFLPGTGIPNLETAWSLVEPLGPSATILLDTWHWVRQKGGPALQLLSKIPGDRIGYVQICDAAAERQPDVMAEAMTGRLLPGEGIVDFQSVFSTLTETGAAPFLATEVFNTRLVQKMGPRDAAVAMLDAARSVVPG